MAYTGPCTCRRHLCNLSPPSRALLTPHARPRPVFGPGHPRDFPADIINYILRNIQDPSPITNASHTLNYLDTHFHFYFLYLFASYAFSPFLFLFLVLFLLFRSVLPFSPRFSYCSYPLSALRLTFHRSDPQPFPQCSPNPPPLLTRLWRSKCGSQDTAAGHVLSRACGAAAVHCFLG